MKIKLGITVLVLITITIVILRSDWVRSQSTQERIESAISEFQDIVQNNPTQRVEVAVFFARNVPLEELGNAVSRSNVLLKGFRHGTPGESGGYILRDGETVDEAIKSYRRDHEFFLEERLKLEEPIAVSTAIQPELRQAFSDRVRITKELQKDFKINGLSVIGTELEGEALEVEKFREMNPFVRVVELKKRQRPQTGLFPRN